MSFTDIVATIICINFIIIFAQRTIEVVQLGKPEEEPETTVTFVETVNNSGLRFLDITNIKNEPNTGTGGKSKSSTISTKIQIISCVKVSVVGIYIVFETEVYSS